MPRKIAKKDRDNKDLELMKKLALDIPYFLESCVSIIDKERNQVPFRLNHVQKLYWPERTANDVILKHRKPGFSTLFCGELLHACIFTQNVSAVVAAHREEDTLILFDKVKAMHKSIDLLEVPVDDTKASMLYFPVTNSYFRVVTAAGKNPGRSRDITHLHLSERAFYESDLVVTGLEEACVPKARRIIETTANGAGTPFHKFWKACKAGQKTFKTFFYAWWSNPENVADPVVLMGGLTKDEKDLIAAYNLTKEQLAWRRMKLQNMTDPGMFPQEHPANDTEAFLSSGRSVFDWMVLNQHRSAALKVKWRGFLQNIDSNIRLEVRPDGELTVYRQPNRGSRYVISADVAEGVPGGAYSVADVFDCDSWEQVAQWRGRINPVLFGNVMADLGMYYNSALLAPEINNHGIATFAQLENLQYPNLYTRPDAHNGGVGSANGFQTTSKTKVIIINELGEAVRNMDAKINSDVTLDEMQGFVVNVDGTYANADGEKTDSVMSAAIGIHVLKEVAMTPRSTRTKFKEAFGIPDHEGLNREYGGYGRRNG